MAIWGIRNKGSKNSVKNAQTFLLEHQKVCWVSRTFALAEKLLAKFVDET